MDAGARAEPGAGGGRLTVELNAVRDELEAGPRTFWFRDDDAGWAHDRLFALLDLFASYGLPLDAAVIPAALDAPLAERLVRRGGHVAFHQHGFAHTNHEPAGRPCEFGPARSEEQQRGDIVAGAARLAELLGETTPVFTPPWNRCTDATGRCLRELGFRALARDSTATPLGLDGLQELRVQVDWARPDVPARLAAAARASEPVGVMLHHALLGSDERARLESLLALLAEHPNARCVPMASLLETVAV
jgi:peptidoglycan/xylan/chitin deacetylase (PgdA/CDA1 family)